MISSKVRVSVFAWVLLVLLAAPLAAQEAWAAGGLAAGDSAPLTAQTSIVAKGRLAPGACQWTLNDKGTLTILPGKFPNVISDFKRSADVKKIVFKVQGDNKVVMKTAPAFEVSSEEGDYDGEGWISWASQFPNLKSIDLKGLDTSQATDLTELFTGCAGLKSIDVSPLDTSKAKYLPSFQGCVSLESLDLSSFDTSKAITMSSMFSGCNSLKSLDLSSFDTSNVESFDYMFSGCSALKTLNLSGFDTSKATSFEYMFSNCKSLKSLDLSFFDTSNVESMGYMFEGCKSLKNVNLTSFDTSKTDYLRGMFYRCRSLENLDLTSFDTSNVTIIDEMFHGCKSLCTIAVSDSWSTDSVRADCGYSLFTGCDNIEGDNGTYYDPEHVDYDYARLDNPDAPGYLTYKDRSSITLPNWSKTYNGKRVKYEGKPKLGGSTEGAAIKYFYYADKRCSNRLKAAQVKNAGIYYVRAQLAAEEGSGGAVSNVAKLTVKRAPQKITAKNCSAAVTAKGKGSSRALPRDRSVNLKKKAGVSAKTKVRYAKANKSGGKKIAVNKKTGRVSLKKGLKAGTYKVKVRLIAPQGKNYKAAKAKTITLKVKVK